MFQRPGLPSGSRRLAGGRAHVVKSWSPVFVCHFKLLTLWKTDSFPNSQPAGASQLSSWTSQPFESDNFQTRPNTGFSGGHSLSHSLPIEPASAVIAALFGK